MIIVTWKRGKEWNYFYCDTIDEALEFKEKCEKHKNNSVVSIESFTEEGK